MPFASLGVIGVRRIPSKMWKRIAAAGVFLAGVFSVFVNLVGAVQGAMYCNLAKYALPDYLATIMRGELRSFPLRAWLLPLAFLLWFFAALKFAFRALRIRESERATAPA